MARGKRPVSFRTRKLSLSAPMVLPWRRGGRVGRRRTTIPDRGPSIRAGAPVGMSRQPRAPNDRTLPRGKPGLPPARRRRIQRPAASCRPHAAHCSRVTAQPSRAGRECTKVRRLLGVRYAEAPRRSAAGRVSFVVAPTLSASQAFSVPQIAPGGADLVEGATLVEPFDGLPGPCRVQRLVPQEFEPFGVLRVAGRDAGQLLAPDVPARRRQAVDLCLQARALEFVGDGAAVPGDLVALETPAAARRP